MGKSAFNGRIVGSEAVQRARGAGRAYARRWRQNTQIAGQTGAALQAGVTYTMPQASHATPGRPTAMAAPVSRTACPRRGAQRSNVHLPHASRKRQRYLQPGIIQAMPPVRRRSSTSYTVSAAGAASRPTQTAAANRMRHDA